LKLGWAGLSTIGSMKGLTRFRRLLTLHETRRALVSAARSGVPREVLRRARSDRRGLLREWRDPSTARAAFWAVARHPATHELVDVGMLTLPGRYVRLGWHAARFANGLRRRGAR
jgi:hypothetical protein